MKTAIIIQGTYTGRAFIPDGPLPDAVGRAELIVVPEEGSTPAAQPKGTHSAFDVFGKAPVLRSREDIDAQIREERESWGDR